MGGGFLLKGGGVSCFFCPTGKKKELGVCRIADVVCAVETEGESSSRAEGARGGAARVSSRLQYGGSHGANCKIFVCRNVFSLHRPGIDCTLDPFALFLIQQESSKCRLEHTVQSAERL